MVRISLHSEMTCAVCHSSHLFRLNLKKKKKGRAFILGPIALGGIFILMQLASVIDSGNEVSYDQALVCLTNRKQPRHIVEREKKKQ